MSNKINARLGLKPQTRTRQATHGSGIVSYAICPACGGQHVVEHVVHGAPLRLCGFCSTTWTPTPAERAEDAEHEQL